MRKNVKAKEWITFWLFFFAYGFTAVITILDFFIFKIIHFPVFLISLFAAIFTLGFLLRLVTIHHLGKFHSIHIKIQDDHKIIQKGIYKYLRHPMYLSNLMIFIGGAGMFSSILGLLSAFILIVPVTVLRIYKEEYFLIQKFGNDYKSYRIKTKRLMPGIW